jgi:hypothetical protein
MEDRLTGAVHARSCRNLQMGVCDMAHTAGGRTGRGGGISAGIGLLRGLQEFMDISCRDSIENPSAGAGLPPVQDGDHMA